MLTVKSAGTFQLYNSDKPCSLYSTGQDVSVLIHSIQQALNPQTWRNYYHPFAQVIVDKLSGEYVLVRDHLGIRPLYYYVQDQTLIFADTVDDILQQLAKTPPLIASEVDNLFSDFKLYSDQTLYQGIYRVEPGHMIHGKPDGKTVKLAYWQLQAEGEELHYADERDYLEHFSALMRESIQVACQGSKQPGAEFSAGLDSSAVYCACIEQGINPQLFMHAALPSSASALSYNDYYEKAFIAHYPEASIQRIFADSFNPVDIFRQYSQWFAGPSPYIFDMFAQGVHRAVSAKGCDILLSGFGGDQGVSGPVPPRFCLPSLIKNRQFRQAWKTTSGQTASRLLLLAQFAHPKSQKLIHKLRILKNKVQHAFNQQHQLIIDYPELTRYFKTPREAEWAFLQGSFSHEIRMRIEYSSIVTQKMGFEYRYPLLYPKLLEFYLSLPLAQKTRNGVGRYIIKRYLASHLPDHVFAHYKKTEGLNILPATMDMFIAQFEAGAFQKEFQSLPFFSKLQHKVPKMTMIKSVQAFMLKEYQTHTDSLAASRG